MMGDRTIAIGLIVAGVTAWCLAGWLNEPLIKLVAIGINMGQVIYWIVLWSEFKPESMNDE